MEYGQGVSYIEERHRKRATEATIRARKGVKGQNWRSDWRDIGHPLTAFPTPDASIAVRDPWMALAAAVLLQGVRDMLESPLWHISFGACCWLVNDGQYYCDALGFEIDVAEWAMQKMAQKWHIISEAARIREAWAQMHDRQKHAAYWYSQGYGFGEARQRAGVDSVATFRYHSERLKALLEEGHMYAVKRLLRSNQDLVASLYAEEFGNET